MNKKIAIFPGTFDPFTLGHHDIVKRGLKIFDEIHIAVGNNPKKERYFDVNIIIKKIEEFKVKKEEKEKKEKPLKDRKREYKKIDDLLFEALVEKHEEGRPEKMVEYLKLRKEIKDKHPLED